MILTAAVSFHSSAFLRIIGLSRQLSSGYCIIDPVTYVSGYDDVDQTHWSEEPVIELWKLFPWFLLSGKSFLWLRDKFGSNGERPLTDGTTVARVILLSFNHSCLRTLTSMVTVFIWMVSSSSVYFKPFIAFEGDDKIAIDREFRGWSLAQFPGWSKCVDW